MSLKDSGQYYHAVLKRIPPRAFPVFEDPGMQERVWGRRWGVYKDVGTLRLVLVHRPGDEVCLMTADRYDPGIEALIDDDAQWYWRGEEAFVTRRLAALGMPILRTIHGSGLFEGGSF